MDDRAQRLADYERRFLRAGLPLLSEDYKPRTDVFTRAYPLLVLVTLLELVAAADVDWSPLANAAAIATAIGLTLVAYAAANRLQGRPALAMRPVVSRVELGIFLLLPPLLLTAVHGGWGPVALLFNAAFLGLVALTFGFGLGAIVMWAAGRVIAQLAGLVLLLARAVPLLLVFALLGFLSTEMWQVFGDAQGATLAAIGVLLALLVLLFLVIRMPQEVRQLETKTKTAALGRLQRANVGLVLLISHGLQIVLVTLAVFLVFAVFGSIAIDAHVMQQWIRTSGDALFTTTLLGVPLRPTTELLRVAGAMACFSGLYFAIAVLTDSAYRDEFLSEITREMGETFALRAKYLALRAEAAS